MPGFLLEEKKSYLRDEISSTSKFSVAFGGTADPALNAQVGNINPYDITQDLCLTGAGPHRRGSGTVRGESAAHVMLRLQARIVAAQHELPKDAQLDDAALLAHSAATRGTPSGDIGAS